MREARHARKNRRSSRKPVGDHTGTNGSGSTARAQTQELRAVTTT